MTDSFLKMHLSYFYCKKWVSITPILYLFSVALGEIIHLKTYECTLYRMITCIDYLIIYWKRLSFYSSHVQAVQPTYVNRAAHTCGLYSTHTWAINLSPLHRVDALYFLLYSPLLFLYYIIGY